MKKKILLPTDFSENAWKAVLYSMELYKDQECDFYLLNTFNTTNFITGGVIDPEPGEKKYQHGKLKSENGLARLLDTIELKDDGNSKHNFYTISVYNNLLEAIKTEVETKDIYMIVMGTKGETRATNIVLGSNAIDVMEKVRNCPVLVIPECCDFVPPKEIVFPTSYKTHFKQKELMHLIELTKKYDAAIRILHVSEEEELDEIQIGKKKLLEDYFEGLIYTFHALTNINVQTAINCFVESRESDMVAFINKKHTFFGSVFSMPLVKGVGTYSKVPVLVMHDLRN